VIRVCTVGELPSGEVFVVAGDPRIAVFNADGEFFAVEDRCTHQHAYLSDGFVEGCLVECPLHASCFDLRTGKPSGPPATEAVRTYPVEVRDGDVYVELP
jgi:3-phenylpropionate/trans-cinnamate dioxygenase ferredoxin subunit